MASWRDTYEQLKKRKKQIDEGTNVTVTNNGKKTTVNLPSVNRTTGLNTLPNLNDDMLPLPKLMVTPNNVRQNTIKPKKEEEKEWYKQIFDSGAFSDGYDFGDVTKTILGTTADVGVGVVKGVSDIGLAGAKLTLGGVAQISDWLGNDKYADELRNRIAGKDKETNEKLKKYTPSGWLETADEKLDDASLLGETGDEITQGVGYYAGMLAAQSVGVPWQVIAGSTSMGNELANAYANGATDGEAWLSAGISAGVEIGTEYLSGGIKLPGTGKTADKVVSKLTEKISKNGLKYLAEAGYQVAGEGLEEVLAGYGSAIGQKLTYMDDKELSELYSSEDALKDFVIGAVVSGITNGSMQSTHQNIKEGRSLLTGRTYQEAIYNTTPTQQTTGNQETVTPVQETTQQPVNTQETVEDIDNQIAILEEQLMATESEVEYENLSKQIKELEKRAEQLENGTVKQNTAPVQEQVQNNEQATFKTANVEQTKQPTTQEVESNLATDVVSNTQEVANRPVIEETSPDKTGQVKIASEQQSEQQTTKEPQVMTEEEYLASKGYGFMGYSEAGLHKGSKNESTRGRKQAVDLVQERAKEYDAKRQELRKEYQAKLESGEIRKPTSIEQSLKTAQGLEDNPSVQAARRVLAKRGIDWKTGKPLQETNNKSTNTVENSAENTTETQQTVENTTPTQEELDNLENTRKNKSGSEYASEYYALGKKYGTTNLYKALNNYKSTGKALDNEIAPVRKELAETTKDLVKTIKDTTKEMKSLKKELNDVKTSVSELVEESKALTEADIPFIEQQQKDAPVEDIAPVRNNLTPEETQELDELEDLPFVLSEENQARLEELQAKEKGLPEYQYENDNEGNRSEVEDPFKDRDFEDVGSRKVKAYQYEHPEVRPFFQEEARYMLNDLDNSQKGQRFIIGDISQTGGGNFEFSGQKRHTTKDIAELLDSQYNYKYDDIRKGLNAIIEDHGAENIAVAKRIEFALNDRLLKGYTDINGYKIPPNEEYINFLKDKQFNDYLGNVETNDIAPVENKETLPKSLDIAPVREDFDNGGPMLRVSPEMEQKTTSKKVDWDSLEDTSKGEQQHLKVRKLGETLTPNNKNLDTIDETLRGNQQQINLRTGTLEDSIEKKTKKQIKKELLQKTGILNVSLDEANKIPKPLMENTDPIRLQEMVFGRGLGNEINRMFFQKVKDNTSEKIRFQNKERADIKSLGIKARSKESAAVQKYGEKQWTNEITGETLPYGDKELASEFPNVETQERIKKASEVIRRKYDIYLNKTNRVLTNLGYDAIPKRKDYMRHFQELNDVFSRVGIPYNYNELTANELPTDINGLTADFSPSKNFFASTLQRKGNKTTYDAITGIDGYLEGIGNLIYHTEDIQRLRAYEEYIRDTYGESHGYDNLEKLSDGEKIARIEKIQDNHLSNYASWLHEYTNVLAGKKAFIDRGVEHVFGRKIYSFLNTAKTQVGRNMIGFNISSAMTNAIAGVQTLAKTNKIATVKGLADTVKNTFSKDGFVEKNNFLTSRFGSEMLSKNLWQRIGDAGFVFMQGADYFVSNFVVRSKYNELKSKGYTDEQAHREAGKYASRLMSDRSQGAMPNIYNSQMLGVLTQFQNEVNNQVYSMFYDTYHESKEKAQGNALKTTAGITFTLGQLAVFTHLFGAGFEAMAGYNPTFDIIGMLMKAFGLDDEEDSEDTTLDNLSQAFEQLGKALPYVSILLDGGRVPISEALPLRELLTGKDEFGNDKSSVKTLMEALPYHVLPTGYSQAKKTVQGLGMYDEDLPVAGSYTDSGNLRFTAEDDTWSKIQAGIFGRWANESAKDYVKSEFKTIKKSNIDELVDLGMNSTEYRKYRDGLSEHKTNEDKIEYINSLDVTDEQKNIMANNLLDRDYKVDMSIYDDFGSYDEFDFSYKNTEKYEWLKSNNISYEEYVASDESKELYNYAFNNPDVYKTGMAITGDFKEYKEYKDYIYDLKADKDSEGKSITGTRKTKVIDYVDSLDLDIPQKAILIRQEYSTFTEYNYDIIDYVDNLDIPYEDKVGILTSLDMEVSDDGTISW